MMSGSFGEPITSEANPTFKFLYSLRRRHVRQAERLFVVEGTRAVEDALMATGGAHVVLVRDGASWRAPVAGVDVRTVSPRLFDRLAETESPQPVIGVFPFPQVTENLRGAALYLLIDGVRDPGNLGTLLRSAAAAGVSAVLLGADTVDPFNGKVVRSAMGAHFRVAILPFDQDCRARLRLSVDQWVLADPDGALDYDAVAWTQSSVVIVGSEAHGPSEAARALATVRCAIPLANGVESLNAGVAGSVILFEAVRQRRSMSLG